MDMSKLPRLSQRPAASEPAEGQDPHADAPSPVPQARMDPPPVEYAHRAPLSSGLAEAWISLAVGVLLLLMVPHTLLYASSKVFHTTFAPFADPTRPYPARCDFIQYTDGTRVYYRDLPQFWSDLAITAFAVALLFDGVILLAARRRFLVATALAITLLATAGNCAWLVGSYSRYGIALLSALAMIFGIYIAMTQWSMLRSMRSTGDAGTRSPHA